MKFYIINFNVFQWHRNVCSTFIYGLDCPSLANAERNISTVIISSNPYDVTRVLSRSGDINGVPKGLDLESANSTNPTGDVKGRLC